MLADDEVHLWLTAPTGAGPDALARAAALLAPEERARAAAFVRACDRETYVVARVLVRTVLSRYGATPPAAWRFARGPRGRPEIAPAQNPGALRFNLSHTPGLVALAVTRARDVGVDVEAIDRPVDADGIAASYFAPAERAALARLAGPARTEAFFAYWTLKEAYAKARGDGLWLPLDASSFELDGAGAAGAAPRVTFRGVDDRAAAWRFRLLRPGARHRAALALRGDDAAGPLAVRVVRVPPLDGALDGARHSDVDAA